MHRRVHRWLGLEQWAAQSLQPRSDQEALAEHRRRARMRLLWFLGGIAICLLSSFLLELLRHLVGDTPLRLWRILVGAVPGAAGLIAVLHASTAFVQDVYDISGRREARRHAWVLLFGSQAKPTYPHIRVKEGRIDEQHVETLLATLGGPGVVTVFNDSAVVLEQYGRHVRVAGPGTVFLRRFERIHEVLDLRPHERTTEVRALTKEGIPVQTEVQVRFQLARDREHAFPPPPGTAGPVYRWAWKRASQSHRRLTDLDHGVEREEHWPARVMGEVGPNLRTLIATVELDKLMEPYEPDCAPRQRLIDAYRKRLDESIRGFGAQILGVRVGPIRPTLPQVEEERIANWQAFWKARAQREEAKGEAAVIREEGSARAYAQLEIILSLTREFRQVFEQNVALSTELIALRFIEALRHAWSRPDRTITSDEALDTLDRLQDTVERNLVDEASDADE